LQKVLQELGSRHRTANGRCMLHRDGQCLLSMDITQENVQMFYVVQDVERMRTLSVQSDEQSDVRSSSTNSAAVVPPEYVSQTP